MEIIKELEDDATTVIERKNLERQKLEQFLDDLKSCAEKHIPTADRNFHNKWNRVKGIIITEHTHFLQKSFLSGLKF